MITILIPMLYKLPIPFLLWNIYSMILNRHVSIITLFIWLTSLILLFPFHSLLQAKKYLFRTRTSWKEIILLCCIIFFGLLLLFLWNTNPIHFHQDEFITAHTSYSLPNLSAINWFAGFPDNWVARFPILFHILQKPFFIIFGINITSVRISIYPYYILICVLLYHMSQLFVSKRFSLFTVLVFTLFAPSLYLFSMGLHMISSTCFYLLTLVFLIHTLKKQRLIYAFGLGVSLGISFLTYTSSYVSLPTVLVIGMIAVWIKRSKKLCIDLVYGLIVSAVVVFPFAVYALTFGNYFTERINQVNMYTGFWSETSSKIQTGISPLFLTLSQTKDAALSLFFPKIGGYGGYNFGQQALLDPFTSLLFISGCFILIQQSWKKNVRAGFLLLATIIPFFFVFVVSAQPPAFQRLSVIFPLMALIVSIPLYEINKHIKIQSQKFWFFIISTILFETTNCFHVASYIAHDKTLYPQFTRMVAETIKKTTAPGTPITIAAYESFYLKPELLFRLNNRYPLIAGKKEDMIASYSGTTPIIVYNPTFIEKSILQETFKNVVFLDIIDSTSPDTFLIGTLKSGQ